jgi:hypothetical protein
VGGVSGNRIPGRVGTARSGAYDTSGGTTSRVTRCGGPRNDVYVLRATAGPGPRTGRDRVPATDHRSTPDPAGPSTDGVMPTAAAPTPSPGRATDVGGPSPGQDPLLPCGVPELC